ncbi:hypothetical protein Tco_1201414 [Tanacetum coccineum]
MKFLPITWYDCLPVVDAKSTRCCFLLIMCIVLVDEDEDPKEDEFEEEEDPQEEEYDIEVDIEEDENEPELTYPYEEVDPLNPSPSASELEPEDVNEVESPIESEDETVLASVHEVGESSTAPFLREDSDGLLPGLMRREIKSLFVRAHEFFQEMICRGFMFEERPNEAINVPIEDAKSPSSEPVDAAIAAERARQANVRNDASGSGPVRGQDTAPAIRECTFVGFMKCNPTSSWVKGAVKIAKDGLRKTESVSRSGWQGQEGSAVGFSLRLIELGASQICVCNGSHSRSAGCTGMLEMRGVGCNSPRPPMVCVSQSRPSVGVGVGVGTEGVVTVGAGGSLGTCKGYPRRGPMLVFTDATTGGGGGVFESASVGQADGVVLERAVGVGLEVLSGAAALHLLDMLVSLAPLLDVGSPYSSLPPIISTGDNAPCFHPLSNAGGGVSETVVVVSAGVRGVVEDFGAGWLLHVGVGVEYDGVCGRRGTSRCGLWFWRSGGAVGWWEWVCWCGGVVWMME